jgi:hypothetical protein
MLQTDQREVVRSMMFLIIVHNVVLRVYYDHLCGIDQVLEIGQTGYSDVGRSQPSIITVNATGTSPKSSQEAFERPQMRDIDRVVPIGTCRR